MKIDNKKLENFWYYHKNHVVIASVAIFLIVGAIIFLSTTGKEADIYVSYINKALTLLPSIIDLEKRFSMRVSDANNGIEKTVSISNVIDSIKAEIVLQAGQADIHLCNRARIEKAAGLGLFEPLDNLIAENKINVDNINVVKLTPDGSDQEHIYAISLENCGFAKEYNMDFSDIYFSVRRFGNMKDVEKREELRENASSILMGLLK